jgi:hypothetical protein
MARGILINGFQKKNRISELMKLRKDTKIPCYILSEALGITEDEYRQYESGLEDIPASVLFHASLILTGNPLELFENKKKILEPLAKFPS